jgi:hypothetical protein
MTTFANLQAESEGQLTMFDRVLFKGHLTRLYPDGNFSWFLRTQGVLLKDYKGYAQQVTGQIKAAAQSLAAEQQRPYRYLNRSYTAARGCAKEDLAREIAAQEQVTEGLICVLGALEMNTAFSVRGNRGTQQLAVVRERRKCLHLYFYYLDAEFGFMHIRLQTWFPFEIQIYINGREWLARQLDVLGSPYTRYDNCFLHLADVAGVQALAERFAHREWARVLQAFARRVNPFLSTLQASGYGEYYWVTQECEIATDLMFPSTTALAPYVPELYRQALLNFGARDVMQFLGRKLHGNYQGEIRSDLKQRAPGWRVKHRAKSNSIKMYDKRSVLRIETTINKAREFKRLKTTADGTRRWQPMGKGVANFWRCYQVGRQANQRYLQALATLPLQGEGVQALDALCRPRTKHGQRYARFNPLDQETGRLFAAVLAGEHLINGFRNRHIQAYLYTQPPTSTREAKRRCARVSRAIRKLRGHSLIAKVKDARLYRVTKHGRRAMSAALQYRLTDFPNAYDSI